MLIQLYREEDKRFGVDYKNGILGNLERPLLPKQSYYIKKQEEI